MTKDREDKLNQYIDDLNNEKKPNYDDDLSELFETVRAVRSLRDPQRNAKGVNNKVKKKPIIRKLIATAAMFILFFTGFIYFSGDDTINIASAMMDAYESITGYQGVLSFSYSSQEVDINQVVEIIYQKDNKFHTVTHTNDSKFTRIFDGGEKMISFHGDNPSTVIIDYMDQTSIDFYLKDYHLKDYIHQMQHAIDVEIIDTTTILGQEVDVYQYRFVDDQPFSKVWLNKENLPLKIEANYNGSVMIREFLEFEINPNIDPSIFIYEISSEQEVHYTSEKPEEESLSPTDLLEASGFYVGQIDNTTIEINLVDSETLASSFSILNLSDNELDKIDEASLVTITFDISEDGVVTLYDIKQVDNIKVLGTYLGDADSTFSEFIISGQGRVLAITEEARQYLYDNQVEDEEILLTIEPSSFSQSGIITKIEIK